MKSEMVSNILAVYNKANALELKEGVEWYRGDAWAFCLNLGWQVAAALGQLSDEMEDRHWARFVAATVSALSPQKEWRVNKALAYTAVMQVLAGETVTGHYGPQCEKVCKLYRYFLINRGVAFSTEAVLSILSKPTAQKTRNFYLNITGNYDVVTVDGHAASICEHGLERVSISTVKQPNGAAYLDYVAAYVEAAQLLGVEPATVQAVTWVTYRRLGIVTK